MSTEPSCFTYAMCSAFLKAVTGALWISVEAAWGLQLNVCSIVQMSGSLSCSHRNYIQTTSVWKGRNGRYQPTITSSAKKPSAEEFDLADVRRLTALVNNFALLELPFGAKLSLVISQQAQPNVFAKIIYHHQSCRRQIPGRTQAHEMVWKVFKFEVF